MPQFWSHYQTKAAALAAAASHGTACLLRRLGGVAELKPAYLVCGDDDAKIDAWRARVRRGPRTSAGRAGWRPSTRARASRREVAASLAMLSFETATRYLLVDDVGAWKAGELGPLEEALAELPPETVLVLIARGKAAEAARQGGRKGRRRGARVRRAEAMGAAEVVRRARARARSAARPGGGEGARGAGSARASSGSRGSSRRSRSRCTRRPRSRPRDVEQLAAGDTAPGAYDLADALVAGDLRGTLALAEQLDEHGERPGRLVWPIVRRLREVHQAAALLASGHAGRQGGGGPRRDRRGPAKKVIARAKKADRGHAGAGASACSPTWRWSCAAAGDVQLGRGHGVLAGAAPARAALGPVGYHHSFGAILVSMCTCFVSWKASRPSWPSSRPRPDCFIPPNGPASLSVSGSLIQTVPALISRMQRTAVSRSRV